MKEEDIDSCQNTAIFLPPKLGGGSPDVARVRPSLLKGQESHFKSAAHFSRMRAENKSLFSDGGACVPAAVCKVRTNLVGD